MLTLLKHTTRVYSPTAAGLQKEAYSPKSPVLLCGMKQNGLELVEHGYNKLAGADKDLIPQAFT